MPALTSEGSSLPDRSLRHPHQPLPIASTRSVLRAFLVLVTLSSSACQHQPPDTPAPEISAADAENGSPATHHGAVLTVENHRYADIVVYLVSGGQRMRMGMVRAVGSKTFEVPQRLFGQLGSFHLIADPIGERGTLDSGVIYMRPGARIEWVLETSLQMSSLAIY